MDKKTSYKTTLSVLSYDAKGAYYRENLGFNDIAAPDGSKITWINVSGLSEVDDIQRLIESFSIHEMTVEDVFDTDNQPKTEHIGDYTFISMKVAQTQDLPEKAQGGFYIEQVSFILKGSVLLTFQEIPGDPFDRVRKLIIQDISNARNWSVSNLAYELMDAAINDYFTLIDKAEDELEAYENALTKLNDDKIITEVQSTKNDLLKLRRAIAPLRIVVASLATKDPYMSSDDMTPYAQDLIDSVHYAIDSLDGHRQWLSELMDLKLAYMSHRMNKVMQLMATVSVIFMPLTFIVGIYGMNFTNMPELTWRYGYLCVMALMALMIIVMVAWFKKKKWF